jgi:hypothetical protein
MTGLKSVSRPEGRSRGGAEEKSSQDGGARGYSDRSNMRESKAKVIKKSGPEASSFTVGREKEA